MTSIKDQNKEKVFFIIPAFNEEENMDFLLNNIFTFMRFFRYEFHIIVVNDGSIDSTAGVVERLQNEIPITLLNHETNYGPGVAFKTGFHKALEMARDDDMLVTIEADNTSDLCVLNRMLEQCKRGSDLVLASVYGEGRIVGASLYRKLLSRCANTMMKIIFRIKGVNTFTSFFRVYKASMLKKAVDTYGDKLIEETGFISMLELLIKLHLLNFKITQTPMLLDSSIRIGDSKMKTVKNIKDTLRLIYRYFLNARDIFIHKDPR
jgi:dolichol-phosphate mannosyltransferase